jgi:hypothetical protein
MQFRYRRGVCVVLAAATFALGGGCGAQSDDDNTATTGQSAPAQAQAQPSPAIDTQCGELPLAAHEVANALKTTVTSGTYAAGTNSQGVATLSCSYTTSMQRPGGKSEQDRRVVYVVREPNGLGTWNQLTARMTDGVEVIVNNTDEAVAHPATKLPFVIYRKGKEVVHITFLNEDGTADGHNKVMMLAGIAANK